MNVKSLAVFCGSTAGKDPLYLQHTIELGEKIAAAGIKLVYGGGHTGLMGLIADTVLQNGGQVLGVIPEVLISWERQHKGLTELVVATDMHSRKRLMYEKSDAAVILPGGYGTLDELFEMVTWNQLKIHDKKIYILNSGGFYNSLLAHLFHLQEQGFLYEPVEKRISWHDTTEALFSAIDQSPKL